MRRHLKKPPLELLFALVAGAIVRFFDISTYPPGPFADEVTIPMYALEIARPSFDYPFPMYFGFLGQVLSTVPFVAILGPVEHVTRIVSALYGTGMIFLLYAIAERWFGRKTAAWTAVFLAFSPWHIHMSRIGMEYMCSLFWVAFTLWILERRTPEPLSGTEALGALAASTMALFSYGPVWMYLPPLLSIWTALSWNRLAPLAGRRRVRIVGALLAVVLTAAVVGAFPQLLRRLTQVEEGKVTPLVFVKRYFSYFSVDFLFRLGDAGYPGQYQTRQSVLGMGQLYWFQLVLIPAGVLAIWRRRDWRRETWLLLAMTVLYPMGSVFSSSTPRATRAIYGNIPLTVWGGLGAAFLEGLLSRAAIVRAGLASVLALSFAGFANLARAYVFKADGEGGWQLGYRDAYRYLSAHGGKYDQVLITPLFANHDGLQYYYNYLYPCAKCRTAPSPPTYSLKPNHLVALRPRERDEVLRQRPGARFYPLAVVHTSSGAEELVIGEFHDLW